jgi:hypothetical protein
MTSRTTKTTKHPASRVVTDTVSWPIGIAAYSPDGIPLERSWERLVPIAERPRSSLGDPDGVDRPMGPGHRGYRCIYPGRLLSSWPERLRMQAARNHWDGYGRPGSGDECDQASPLSAGRRPCRKHQHNSLGGSSGPRPRGFCENCGSPLTSRLLPFFSLEVSAALGRAVRAGTLGSV